VLRREAFGSFTLQHTDLIAVLVGMTRFAVSCGVLNPEGVLRMLNFQVALEAIDFVVCYVCLVHELVIVDAP
jgi:hypothetical protein